MDDTKLSRRYPGLLDGPGLILNMLRDLQRIWGHARLGLALVEAHNKEKCLSSDEIAELTGLHRDTIRRHLKGLTETGRVRSIKNGRSICYAADERWAEQTHEKLRRLTEWVLANHDKPGIVRTKFSARLLMRSGNHLVSCPKPIINRDRSPVPRQNTTGT